MECSNTLYLVASLTNSDDYDDDDNHRTDSNTQTPDTIIRDLSNVGRILLLGQSSR